MSKKRLGAALLVACVMMAATSMSQIFSVPPFTGPR